MAGGRAARVAASGAAENKNKNRPSSSSLTNDPQARQPQVFKRTRLGHRVEKWVEEEGHVRLEKRRARVGVRRDALQERQRVADAVGGVRGEGGGGEEGVDGHDLLQERREGGSAAARRRAGARPCRRPPARPAARSHARATSRAHAQPRPPHPARRAPATTPRSCRTSATGTAPARGTLPVSWTGRAGRLRGWRGRRGPGRAARPTPPPSRRCGGGGVACVARDAVSARGGRAAARARRGGGREEWCAVAAATVQLQARPPPPPPPINSAPRLSGLVCRRRRQTGTRASARPPPPRRARRQALSRGRLSRRPRTTQTGCAKDRPP